MTPKPVYCYDMLNCQHPDCPVYNQKNYACWEIPSTFCAISDNYYEKIEACVKCPVFHNNLPLVENSLYRLLNVLKHTVADKKLVVAKLNEIRNMLPMCCICKRIRMPDGSWLDIEAYIKKVIEKDVSHGLCSNCIQKHYTQFFDKKEFK